MLFHRKYEHSLLTLVILKLCLLCKLHEPSGRTQLEANRATNTRTQLFILREMYLKTSSEQNHTRCVWNSAPGSMRNLSESNEDNNTFHKVCGKCPEQRSCDCVMVFEYVWSFRICKKLHCFIQRNSDLYRKEDIWLVTKP